MGGVGGGHDQSFNGRMRYQRVMLKPIPWGRRVAEPWEKSEFSRRQSVEGNADSLDFPGKRLPPSGRMRLVFTAPGIPMISWDRNFWNGARGQGRRGARNWVES